eukprot:TRINITY_DN15534_c1_g3_i1.p1 TRINITY_DN15534_c1_g3~~TRINITY_DN15534_c1_g3_i1.p1  ORF type:complete len:696 (-),score=128.82 TRINITY_DN15534_c1_g3_i1:192-2279(-)
MEGKPRQHSKGPVRPLDPTSLQCRLQLPCLSLDSVLSFRVKQGALERVGDAIKVFLEELTTSLPEDFEALVEVNQEAFVDDLMEKSKHRLLEWQLRLSQAEASIVKADRAKAELARMREAYLKEITALRQQLQKQKRAEEKGETFVPDVVALFNPAAFATIDEEAMELLKQQAANLEQQYKDKIINLQNRNHELREKLATKTMHAALQGVLIEKRTVDEEPSSSRPEIAVQTESWDVHNEPASDTSTLQVEQLTDTSTTTAAVDTPALEKTHRPCDRATSRRATSKPRQRSNSVCTRRMTAPAKSNESDQELSLMLEAKQKHTSGFLAPEIPTLPTLTVETQVQTELDTALLRKAEELMARETENTWLLLSGKAIESEDEEEPKVHSPVEAESKKRGSVPYSRATTTDTLRENALSPSSPCARPASVGVHASKQSRRPSTHNVQRKAESINNQADTTITDEERKAALRSAKSKDLGSSSCNGVQQLLDKHGVGVGAHSQNFTSESKKTLSSIKLDPLHSPRPHSSAGSHKVHCSSASLNSQNYRRHSEGSLAKPELSDTESDSESDVDESEEETVRDVADKVRRKRASETMSQGHKKDKFGQASVHVVHLGESFGQETVTTRHGRRHSMYARRGSSRASSRESSRAPQELTDAGCKSHGDAVTMRISSKHHVTSFGHKETLTPKPPGTPRQQGRM